MKCGIVRCVNWRSGVCGLFESCTGGGTPSCEGFEPNLPKSNSVERISPGELIYQPSELEKAFTNIGYPPIPRRGYHTLYERAFSTPTHTVVAAYLEGGNNNGDRISVVVMRKIDETRAIWGWAPGFQFPVPSAGFLGGMSEFFRAIKRFQADTLWHSWEVPGFDQDHDVTDAICRHVQGWFTGGLFAYELPTPACLPDAMLFRIREGIYAVFPNGTIRLMPPKEYYSFRLHDVPVARQGDLLLFRRASCWEGDRREAAITVDRHRLVFSEPVHMGSGTTVVPFRPASGDNGVELTITHPEHAPVSVHLDGVEYEVCLLPGVSRPFSHGGVD